MTARVPLKLISLALASVLLCSGCQSLIPQAQGLVTSTWSAQSYQRQDQIEVQWKEHSFSFLLYQEQQGSNLDMVALSLTGQQLFKLSFNGNKVQVEQRIDAMKLLPFDYVVRDILYATYPDFAKMQSAQVSLQQQDDMQMVLIQNQPVLKIKTLDDSIELNNIQVPYQMVISPVSNTLENDEGMHGS
ncbi:DUF3261 domain-containing protein [Acinetobacter sp. LoGeW2-3]|uniref:DUF3261 domain-containing protein n=1 Tax=Acinetobacter sp. LoGeW2-3 TaxID=1808001 RepID=UPI000C05B665|nr:DUF3261 domain-containing protein [Acinetobacter sp. LoGeW2-3]ATO18617.1 DUF3261 domain-containing protein [Acinetobacter sp. LoGeW2-3]